MSANLCRPVILEAAATTLFAGTPLQHHGPDAGFARNAVSLLYGGALNQAVHSSVAVAVAVPHLALVHQPASHKAARWGKA